jgi:putative restriction endonuclease
MQGKQSDQASIVRCGEFHNLHKSKMPNVAFEHLQLNQAYSRHDLARMWGYKGPQALSRGVVTPARQSYIILFVTHEKQTGATQYKDRLERGRLYWEGPRDHFGENRILNAISSRDEVHLFYRERHHLDFVYKGGLALDQAKVDPEGHSHFVFRLLSS